MLTPAQLEARKLGIGGSDAAAVVGLSPYTTPFQLYLEKRGEAPPSEEYTLAMKFGALLEEPIVEHYCDVTKRQVRRQPLTTHAVHPWMLANIDRQILNDTRGPGILEVKTTNDFIGKAIQGLDDVPDHYYLQLQHYLSVYDYEWGSLAILIGGSRFVWFDVSRNQAVIDELIRQESAFWAMVQAGTPPTVDGSERTGELLKRMYPKDAGKTILLDAPPLLQAAERLRIAKATIKDAEEEVTSCQNMLKSAIGDASIAELPGWGSISWKTNKDGRNEWVDLDMLKAQFPEAHNACFKSEAKVGARPFLLKPNKNKEVI